MKTETLLEETLALDKCWTVTSAAAHQPSARIVVTVQETAQLWPHEICPQCETATVVVHDHSQPHQWRHLDVFGRPAFIECALPRGRCRDCASLYQVKPPWQGRSKDFTWQLEAYFLALTKVMPLDKACRFIGESEPRLWSLLFALVDQPAGLAPGQITYRLSRVAPAFGIDDTLDLELGRWSV
jgi:hypothetical protein